MTNCLACMLKPTYTCDNCEVAAVCVAHADQFTVYCTKDGDEGLMTVCRSCRRKVASRYETTMHWSQSLKEYIAA